MAQLLTIWRMTLAKEIWFGMLLVLFLALAVDDFIFALSLSHDTSWLIQCEMLLVRLPEQALFYFPMTVLLGILLGLIRMSRQHELIAWQAMGLGQGKLARWVVLQAGLAGLLLVLMSEWALPQVQSWQLHHEKSSSQFLLSADNRYGFWLHRDLMWMHVGWLGPQGEMNQVSIYQFDHDYHLQMVRKAEQVFDHMLHWQAHEVSEVDWLHNKPVWSHSQIAIWPTYIPPSLLRVLPQAPLSMTLTQLWNGIRRTVIKDNNQSLYQAAFWQRCALPVNCLLMSTFAIPLVMGSRRFGHWGFWISLAIFLGLILYLIQQTMVPFFILKGLNPIFAEVITWAMLIVISLLLRLKLRLE